MAEAEHEAAKPPAAHKRAAQKQAAQKRTAQKRAAEARAAERKAARQEAAKREREERRERRQQQLGDVVIKVVDLHVEYELFEDRRTALRQRLFAREGTGHSVIHAVKGVTFSVRQGESVGVLGANGSGKSTLLAAIAGLLPTTSGEILVSDEPKLLGIGAALIPNATGRRNAKLGSLALGVSLDDLDEHVEEVIAVSELADAIDRPMRTYSSGMRARLHFAIATSVQPKILLIDEALSVGDRSFRAKSKARVDALLDNAGVLMMVNHSMTELANQCDRGLWLDQGVLRADGPIDDVIELYEKLTDA